ncbi:MAG: NAD(P)H-dependent oxidoreductase subunit E, partial [Dehalococcoidales bacterium]|nr:NAD(P)H-dependent oxidoreductase subunit E [Dehalococcoidales bacterium]
IVKICRGTACHVRGGEKILEETEKQLGVKAGETTEDLGWTLETIACFGACALAPVMVIDKDVHGRMVTNKVKDVLTGTK